MQAKSSKQQNLEAIYPLTPMQEGLLFETLSSSNWEYFQQMSCALSGDLDVSMLKRSWEHAVERHSILRTSFVWERTEKPLQVVRRKVRLPWHEYDWREMSAAEQQRQLKVFLHADRQQGFELTKAPLMRLSLLRLSDDNYQLVWSYHHLLMDGWSGVTVKQEVVALYNGFRRGRKLELAQPRPYSDYVTWLQRQKTNEAETYWRARLKGFRNPTPLGEKRLSSPEPHLPAEYKQAWNLLDEKVTAALQSFAKQNRLTMNALMRGVWALLLSRYSQQRDVLFGTVVSGRPPQLDGVESMVGVFINTLPVRVEVREDATLLEWLAALQTEQLEMQQYEYTSLVEIKSWSEITQSQPLFNSLLAFEKFALDEPAPQHDHGVRHETTLIFGEGRFYERTNYPLTLVVMPGRMWRLKILFDGELFDSNTVETMLGHLERLLVSIANNPRQKVSSLPFLTEHEEHQLLVEWNDTEIELGLDKCFDRYFEEQVSKTPDAVALICDEQHFTYGELNRCADRLASILIEQGVGPEVLVALLTPRGADLVIAILAVFKAGGAYLPLDTRFPAARLRQLLEESRAPVLLVSTDLLDLSTQVLATIAPEQRPKLIRLSGQQPPPSRFSSLASSHPELLAYVIYTSGSSGVAKGVMIEQRGMMNHLFAKIRNLQLQPADRVAQTAAQSFDISVWQMLAVLLAGGCVDVVGDETIVDPESLLRYARERQVSILELVPSLLQTYFATQPQNGAGAETAEAESIEQRGNLRWLLLTGEALPPKLCGEWLRRYSNVAIMNAYGPTECSDDVTHFEIEREPGEDVLQMPIGRPLENLKMYIVDQRLRTVGREIAGELLVGGVGVGRGYLHDGGRTAEAFVPDFFGEEGQRLYRTGDLAKYLNDGNLVYLGRIDHQVKVRGYRIELGEIEAKLKAHPSIREAVVIVRQENEEEEKQLIAYVVSEGNDTRAVGELRTYLEQELPEPMVPALITQVDAMPLTANGKIDRRALSALAADSRAISRSENGHTFVAARNETEAQLTLIWQEILHRQPISVHDKFFDLGGHSLLALRLLARINQQFDSKLALQALLEGQTIAEMAQLLLPSNNTTTEWSPLVLLHSPENEGSLPFFCVHPATGSAFAYVELARHLKRPFYGLQSRMDDPHTSIEEMAAAYLPAVRAVQPSGPYLLGGWSMGGLVAYEMAVRLQRDGAEVGLVALLDRADREEEGNTQEVLREMFELVVGNIKEQIGKSGKGEVGLSEEIYQQYFNVFVSNFQATKDYRAKKYDGRIMLFSSEESQKMGLDDTLGWGRLVQEVDVYHVPGSHNAMLIPPHVASVAEHLRASIEKVERAQSVVLNLH